MPASDPGPAAARHQATTYVDQVEQARGVERALHRTRDIALDCEAAGFHRYSDRLCLVQLSTPERTFVLDPLAIDLAPHLKPFLEDSRRRTIMHGAAYDLRLLARDLGIRITNLADTQVAASLLGEPAVGLQALLGEHLGIQVSKRYQRADWAKRPLTGGMIDYAAGDTRHLHDLAAILEDRLRERGRMHWAEEEYRWLCASAAGTNEDDPPVDPVTRFKNARRMDDRTVTALREVIGWRDRIARARDRAPFRVVSDQALAEVVATRPASVSALAAVKGFPPRLARSRGLSLLELLKRVDGLPAARLVPFPRPRRRGPRWTPEDDEVLDRLKDVRNAAAVSVGLERGRVMSNQVLRRIVAARPRSRAGLRAVDDVRQWQIEVLGGDLLRVLGSPRR